MSLYYAPEKSGLRVHKSHDRGLGYEYDQVTIFADDATGEYLIGHSSGCSCSAAFDDQTRADLTPVRTLAAVAEFARTQDCWTETDVADLLTGLRLDGHPTVVDGSLIGAEPALPAEAPRPVKDLTYRFKRGPSDALPPAPERAAVGRDLIASLLTRLPVTELEKTTLEQFVDIATNAPTHAARVDAAQACADLVVALIRAHSPVPDTHEARPCSACGRDDSECVAGMRELGLACCGACASHVTHESV